jgi:hypothetical protein
VVVSVKQAVERWKSGMMENVLPRRHGEHGENTEKEKWKYGKNNDEGM